MKTLGEIIELVKDGGKPEYDDLRMAVAVLAALSAFDGGALEKLAEAQTKGQKPFLSRSAVYQHRNHWNTWQQALKRTPLQFLGDNFNPDHPECQRLRAASKKIWAWAEKRVADKSAVQPTQSDGQPGPSGLS